MNKIKIIIYTDGGCSPNPGLGGWAAILISSEHDNHTKEISGYEPETTNNRMELSAAMNALKSLKKSCDVVLNTDSQYLKKAFTSKWLDKWQSNGWKTSNKKPVKNIDLWKELLALTEKHNVTWNWVKGHSVNKYNNRCDALVGLARDNFKKRHA